MQSYFPKVGKLCDAFGDEIISGLADQIEQIQILQIQHLQLLELVHTLWELSQLFDLDAHRSDKSIAFQRKRQEWYFLALQLQLLNLSALEKLFWKLQQSWLFYDQFLEICELG